MRAPCTASSHGASSAAAAAAAAAADGTMKEALPPMWSRTAPAGPGTQGGRLHRSGQSHGGAVAVPVTAALASSCFGSGAARTELAGDASWGSWQTATEKILGAGHWPPRQKDQTPPAKAPRPQHTGWRNRSQWPTQKKSLEPGPRPDAPVARRRADVSRRAWPAASGCPPGEIACCSSGRPVFVDSRGGCWACVRGASQRALPEESRTDDNCAG